jgi:hypothetical protein
MANEYKAALAKAFEELQELLRKRDYLDAEISNKRQYIHAAIRQLPTDDRPKFESQIDALTRNLGSLTEAVREALKFARVTDGKGRGYVTAAQVRDLVMDSGFNFSDYKSNPLSSIHTVLTRRLKPEEVETEIKNGVMHFRWRGQYDLEDVRIAEITS